MKSRILVLLLVLHIAIFPKLFSQNVAINSTGSLPDASAMLDVSSTSKGFLMPRMTSAQRDAIASPATGLTIFNTTIVGYQVNTGTPATPVWSTFGSTSGITSLNGLTGATQTFAIGTTGTSPAWSSAGSVHTLNIPLASAASVTAGLLSKTDYTAFSNKVSTSRTISTTFPLQGGGDLSANRTLSIADAEADGTTKGAATFLDADFNSMSGVIGIDYINGQAASSSNNGFLTSSDWSTFNNKANSFTTGDLTETGSGVLTITGGAGSVVGSGATVEVKQATTSQSGYLSDTDWNTFNNKANSFTTGDLTETGSGVLTITGGTGSVIGSGATVEVKQATTTQDGFLSSTDWNTFNNKLTTIDTSDIPNFWQKVRGLQSAGTGISYNNTTGVISNTGVTSLNGLTGAINFPLGNLTETGSSVLTISGGTGAVIGGGGTALQVKQASGIQDGFLSSSDWTTFNSKLSTIDTTNISNFSQKVQSLFSSTAPLTYSNGLIGITQSGTSSDGYLSSTDWNAFNGKADKSDTANVWRTIGNSVASVQKIGTTTNFDFPFITNNTEKMRLSATGNLGIGTSTFNGTYPEKLVVDAGTTSSVNAIVGKGSINNYLQLNIQNSNAGTNASSDVVATADNGSETTNYVDMGINSSANTSAIMGGANDSYLYNIGQNFLIGTGTAAKSLVLMTGGTSQASNERMRIDGSGNVGIGTTSPSYKLHVAASSNPLFLGGVQTGASTDSLLTILNGVVKKLSPSSLSNAWNLTGNASINATTNFLGTTDSKSLRFRTNNLQRMIIDSSLGNVGIGTSAFDALVPEKLLVDAGTTPYNGVYNAMTPINGIGFTNGYLQIQVQNRAWGKYSSSDLVAASDGTRAGTVPYNTDVHYVDFGINSSDYNNNNSNILNQPYTPYLYSTSPQDFFIGNGYSGKDIVFFTNYGPTNGSNTADGFELMRLKGGTTVGTQQVTIGTATPNGTNKLTVSGSISASAFNVSSDRRLKTNIKNLQYGLKEILALEPVSYNWKTTPAVDKQIGLIAQDTKKTIPEIVSGNEETGKLSINYTELIPVLINAIKEQQQQIDLLKKDIESLKSKK